MLSDIMPSHLQNSGYILDKVYKLNETNDPPQPSQSPPLNSFLQCYLHSFHFSRSPSHRSPPSPPLSSCLFRMSYLSLARMSNYKPGSHSYPRLCRRCAYSNVPLPSRTGELVRAQRGIRKWSETALTLCCALHDRLHAGRGWLRLVYIFWCWCWSYEGTCEKGGGVSEGLGSRLYLRMTQDKTKCVKVAVTDEGQDGKLDRSPPNPYFVALLYCQPLPSPSAYNYIINLINLKFCILDLS